MGRWHSREVAKWGGGTVINTAECKSLSFEVGISSLTLATNDRQGFSGDGTMLRIRFISSIV